MHLGSPLDAREHGIETVYQDLALAPDLDAAANLHLGREIYYRSIQHDGAAPQGVQFQQYILIRLCQRLARTASDRHRGLGLSIVCAIATAHDGTVTAEPKPDGGLVVTVSLPTSGRPPRRAARALLSECIVSRVLV